MSGTFSHEHKGNTYVSFYCCRPRVVCQPLQRLKHMPSGYLGRQEKEVGITEEFEGKHCGWVFHRCGIEGASEQLEGSRLGVEAVAEGDVHGMNSVNVDHDKRGRGRGGKWAAASKRTEVHDQS